MYPTTATNVKLDAQLRTRKLPNSSKNMQTNFVFQIAILSTQLTPEQAFYIVPTHTHTHKHQIFTYL